MTVIDPMPGVRFRADVPARRVEGLLLPWGQVGISGGQRWRFARGSVSWPADVGRVKLLLHHDPARVVGRALWIDDRSDGLAGSFQVARSREGDEVLASAEDGILDAFSVGPRILDAERDPSDPRVQLVRRGELVEVSILGLPAMDDARVERVAAAADPVAGVTGWRRPAGAATVELVELDGDRGFALVPRVRSFYG